MKTKAYAAIRVTDEGQEYIDILTIHCLPDMVLERVQLADKTAPGWARENLFVRVIKINIEEIA